MMLRAMIRNLSRLFKACWVAENTRNRLNKNGYYACSVCGELIDSKGKKGYSSLSELSKENIKSQYSEFCKLCGNFKYYDSNREILFQGQKEPFRDIISPSWEYYTKIIKNTGRIKMKENKLSYNRRSRFYWK